MKRIFFIILLFISLLSCKQNREISLDRVFGLEIGYNEDEVGFFSKDGILNENNLNVFYSAGLYYISDAGNNKILKVTEKGIPVLIIFNPNDNPNLKPTDYKTNLETGEEEFIFVKQYCEFPIYSPELICCNLDKDIYVVNKHPSYKRTIEGPVIADSLILKFSKKGKLLYKLGRDGIDSDPFGHVSELLVDDKGNLILVEQLQNGAIIYSFSQDGILLNKNKITSDDIPLTIKEANYIVDIIGIKLGYISDDVYITCQYVKKKIENISIENYEVVYEKILKYSIAKKKIVKLLKVTTPEYLDVRKIKKDSEFFNKLYGSKDKIAKPIKTLLGLDFNGNFYFSQIELPTNNINRSSTNLFFYTDKGILKKSLLIKYPANVQYISDFFLSSTGKLFSYYIENGEIQFAVIR